MKSLPTILIVLFLAFFLVGCPKPEAPEPESEVKQTEQAEVKTQEQATEPIAEKIPEQEAVEEKKAEIVETPKAEAKAVNSIGRRLSKNIAIVKAKIIKVVSIFPFPNSS